MASSTVETWFLATRRGKLTLALLGAVAFLDFVDASIVNSTACFEAQLNTGPPGEEGPR
jgi:hypothetical protein